MAWSSPRTWSPGETVTAAIMNVFIRDNQNILKTPITDAGKIQAINSTYFSDLSGENLLITSLPKIFRQSADVTKNANTSPGDLTDLAFPVEASKTYHFEATIFVLSTVAADIKLDVTGPASPTTITYQSFGASPPQAAMATSFGDDVIQLGGTFAQVIKMCGTLENGSNAGTVQFRGAQNVSDATNTLFYENSFVIVHRTV